MASSSYYIGLMSGTSLDGVDAVLLEFTGDRHRQAGQAFVGFDASLRRRLLALHEAGRDEIHLAALAGNDLSRLYATAVKRLLEGTRTSPRRVQAIGCHGQTIRHRPDAGYTTQIGNGALLAELTGITVVCDFRSRDVAAGGEGAPLVPAFHKAAFSRAGIHRVIVNIGGIANLTDLGPGRVRGFDTGPGNMLMDAWVRRHKGKSFDANGKWAAGGTCNPPLLRSLLSDPYFSRRPPKSTGRELFGIAWLEKRLSAATAPRDVQATLLELTARTIGSAVTSFCKGATEVYVCGGGASNPALMSRIAAALPRCAVDSTMALGIHPDWVEACAFAWLGRQALLLRAGNLPEATGARGPRVLGAIYPA
ncbi:MAG TPA: anhydro-N-acetylmuramic acid kinase [Burkholderiales bacterium]|nr:anhydro-N-acetylmuramic acid kinase [Burkholderiales bacterium]